MLEKYLSWFKAHERLVVILVVLAFGWHFYGAYLNYAGSKADAKVIALTQLVEQDKQTNQNLAISSATAADQYQKALDSAQKLNVQLAQANAQQSAILDRRQSQDSMLDLPALSARLQTLVPSTAGGVTVANNGLALTDPASHAVVSQLEAVPVLQNQLDTETKIAQNTGLALQSAQGDITACTNQVGGLQTTLKDQQAHETAAIQAEQVKTKKAFRKGLKIGAIGGFIAGLFIGHGGL